MTKRPTITRSRKAQAPNNAAVRRARKAFEQANKARVARGLPSEVGVGIPEMMKRVGVAPVNATQAGMAAMSESTRRRLEGYGRPGRPTFTFPPREVESHFSQLLKIIYEADRLPLPMINVIVFLGKDEAWSRDQDRLTQRFVGTYRGKREVIHGLGQIGGDTDPEALQRELEERLKQP